MIRYLICTLSLLLLAAPAQAKDAADYLTPYKALLAAHVRDGGKDDFPGMMVDYKAWSEDKNHAEAMKQLQAVKYERLTGNEAKAFWINAYNLLIVDLIVQNEQKETIRNIGSVLDDPFKTFTWQLDGKAVRLSEIEEKLSPHADLRLPMALANGTLSGADLRGEPYMAETLEAQLDEQVKRFLNNDKKGLKVRGRVLEVSRIFQKQEVDFEMQGGAVAFLRKYHPQTPPKGVIQGYFAYNWDLNGIW